jgi:hypothetical protein
MVRAQRRQKHRPLAIDGGGCHPRCHQAPAPIAIGRRHNPNLSVNEAQRGINLIQVTHCHAV